MHLRTRINKNHKINSCNSSVTCVHSSIKKKKNENVTNDWMAVLGIIVYDGDRKLVYDVDCDVHAIVLCVLSIVPFRLLPIQSINRYAWHVQNTNIFHKAQSRTQIQKVSQLEPKILPAILMHARKSWQTMFEQPWWRDMKVIFRKQNAHVIIFVNVQRTGSCRVDVISLMLSWTSGFERRAPLNDLYSISWFSERRRRVYFHLNQFEIFRNNSYERSRLSLLLTWLYRICPFQSRHTHICGSLFVGVPSKRLIVYSFSQTCVLIGTP